MPSLFYMQLSYHQVVVLSLCLHSSCRTCSTIDRLNVLVQGTTDVKDKMEKLFPEPVVYGPIFVAGDVEAPENKKDISAR